MVEVLIVGNSQTGALLHRVRRHRNVALAAAQDKHFDQITVTRDGRLTGAQHYRHCEDGADLRRFDLVYVYADLAEPVALLPVRVHRFSDAYLSAHIDERVHQTRAVRLARAIARVMPADRIILIPKPISLNRAADTFKDVDTQVATRLVEGCAGHAIADLKSSIYTINWTPKPECYEGSADWQGAQPDPVQHPNHDKGHLNTRAGSQVFDALKRDVALRIVGAIRVHGKTHKSSPPTHPTPPPPL